MPPIPAPRARNAAATRQSILEAARRRFVDEGYDGASLREIAAEVGVDVALVSRYFGSKDELFQEALTCEAPPDELLTGELATFGERVARMVIADPLAPGKFDNLLMILRSVSSSRAAEVIRRCGEDTFYGPLAAQIGGEDRAVRARLVAALITGFAVLRAIDDDCLLDAQAHDQLQRRIADILQSIVDG